MYNKLIETYDFLLTSESINVDSESEWYSDIVWPQIQPLEIPAQRIGCSCFICHKY
jgi:hypothetical protein